MRIVIQRVKKASVAVDGEICGKIDHGLLVFLAVHKEDQASDIPWLVNKLVNLRIFADAQGKMNLSVQEIGGDILVISQFTLYGNCERGRRPDFLHSASGPFAESLYEQFAAAVQAEMGKVQTGKFAAHMEIALINDGPATFIIDSKKDSK